MDRYSRFDFAILPHAVNPSSFATSAESVLHLEIALYQRIAGQSTVVLWPAIFTQFPSGR